MSVSSVNNNPYLAALYAQYFTSSVNNAASQSGQSAAASALAGIQGIGGDSFQLSSSASSQQYGYTAAMAGANRAQFGPPPPPDGEGVVGQNGGDDAIKSFLDKVAAGTVTDDDLASMESYLQNLVSGTSQASTGTTTTDTSAVDPIRSFLDKVAAGTVTDDDLTSMKSTLTELKAKHGHHGPPPPSDGSSTGTSSDSSGDLLRAFLEKVASGSVTESDLADMQSFLQQRQQQSNT